MKAINTTQIIKPTTTGNFNNLLKSAAISTISLGTLMDRSNDYVTEISPKSSKTPKKEISLLQFMRLYNVGNIPVIDFIVEYVMLCVLNNLYFKLDYKSILIGTIPFTIIFNLSSNPKCKISSSVIIILLMSLGFFGWNWLSIQKNEIRAFKKY